MEAVEVIVCRNFESKIESAEDGIRSRIFILTVVTMAALAFSACGGGNVTTNMPPATYLVGGVVSGLSGAGLVLQNNGGNSLAISVNGAFTFAAPIASGGIYSVTVLTQPSNPAQTCSVTNGHGTANANVTSVQVTCTTVTYTIGGTVSGLSSTGLVVQDNGGDNLPVGANGGFTFATPIASGGTYNVAVLTQPSNPAQTCVATNGSGTANANVTTVQVTCTLAYAIGGTVSGLSGTGLVLQDNHGDNLSLSANGGFTFATLIASGGTYNVTVLTQPSSPPQTCAVTNGSGTAHANVTNVQVTCTNVENVLYNFGNLPDGNYPASNLLLDSSGNLYGTTTQGGTLTQGGITGYGTVFKLTRSNGQWTETVLYSFCQQSNCGDGATPYSGLVVDGAGNLYGTTLHGGAYGGYGGGAGPPGDGVVFELMPQADGSWTESVLHSFGNGTDGSDPSAGLVFDNLGNLYGATAFGGNTGNNCPTGCGTAFELSPGTNGQWTENVLYNFCSQSSCTDGNAPRGTLIFDAAGNLYGTTEYGGVTPTGNGTVFELTPSQAGPWVQTVLHAFNTFQDGNNPAAGLVMDKSGKLYGTTVYGGIGNGNNGTVFMLTQPQGGGQWAEAVIHSFSGLANSGDGSSPYGGVVFDKAGNLWGTTEFGGVFGLMSGNWSEVIYPPFFGASYYAGLVSDPAGNLYGTVFQGGTYGFGMVFEVSP
jgi:uncharacterized repeat protein (TIGR03803 family)